MAGHLVERRVTGATVDWPAGLTAAIVGCGSAGARVARLLVALGVPTEAIVGYDLEDRIGLLDAWPGGCRALPVDDFDDIRAHVWFICTPSHVHANQFGWLALRGRTISGIFVEKPIADSASNMLAYFVAMTEARRVPVQVGYCWRWHPMALRARAWLDGRDLRNVQAVATCAVDVASWGRPQTYLNALGELSHELDTVYGLFGRGRVAWREVREHRWTASIAHDSGASSVVVLDAAHTNGYARSLRMHADGYWFDWWTDAFERSGVLLELGPDGAAPRRAFESEIDHAWTPDEMYSAELRDFLAAVFDGAAVRVSGRDGLEVLRWCDAIRGAA